MKRFIRLAVVTCAVLVVTSAAFATVGYQGPDWRGSEGSTSQTWGFGTSASPAAPESVSNPYGSPSAAINYNPPFGTGWYSTLPEVYGSAWGWWDIADGSIVLGIPNRPNADPASWKDIQISIVYWKDMNQAPLVQVDPAAESVIQDAPVLLENGPVGGAWYRDVWRLRLVPNPDFETISILGAPMWGSQIDEIIIDTRCVSVPEPASLTALVMGGFALLMGRRRQR